jgi:hypothetical protein
MRDIYDPPPAPVSVGPPKPEPVQVRPWDVFYLLIALVPLSLIVTWAWSVDMVLGIGVTISGLFVILESWFSALTFLHRHHDDPERSRWMIFLAALAPWAFGIGATAALLMSLFWLSDWTR